MILNSFAVTTDFSENFALRNIYDQLAHGDKSDYGQLVIKILMIWLFYDEFSA